MRSQVPLAAPSVHTWCTSAPSPASIADMIRTSSVGQRWAYVLSVSDATTVIAHLSDPIARQYLENEMSLDTFIRAEMLYGLKLAVDNQVTNGNGVDPNLEGVLQTPGIQVQAYDTSELITTRKALTKLQTAGIVSGDDDTVPSRVAYVMHPSDWETIELTTASGSGEFLLQNAPVDLVKRRLSSVECAGARLRVDRGRHGAAGQLGNRRVRLTWRRAGHVDRGSRRRLCTQPGPVPCRGTPEESSVAQRGRTR